MGSVTEAPARSFSGIRLVVSTAATFAAFAAFLFVPAGRWDWGQGWAYLGLFAGYMVIGSFCLGRWNPELIDARTHFPSGTKNWDKVWAALYAPVFLAVYVVAALDAARFGWSSMSSAWCGGCIDAMIPRGANRT